MGISFLFNKCILMIALNVLASSNTDRRSTFCIDPVTRQSFILMYLCCVCEYVTYINVVCVSTYISK